MKAYFIIVALAASCLLATHDSCAQPPVPAKIGGQVSIDGVPLTAETASGISVQVLRENGEPFEPAAEDSNGLNSSDCYVIDIPIYHETLQPGGANPEDTVDLAVFKNGRQMRVVSPENGEIVVGEPGSISRIDVAAQTPTYSLYFPHVAAGNHWRTEIAVINDSATDSMAGTLTAFDGEGIETGTAMDISLPPLGRRQISIGDEFDSAEDIRYAIFETDLADFCGYTKFFIPGQYSVALPAASRPNSGDFYVSHIASDDLWFTGIALVNLTDENKEIDIRFDNDISYTTTLSPGQHRSFTVRSLFSDAPQPNIGSAVVENADGLVGLELFGRGTLLSGITLKSETSQTIHLSHLATDQVWSTGIVAYNPGPDPCRITVSPFTASGEPLEQTEVSVEPKKKFVGTVETLGLPEQAAWCRIDGDTPVTGFELFTTRDEKLLAGYTAVGVADNTGVFPKIEKDGATGFALLNVSDQQAEVVIAAFDDNGHEIARRTLTLAPKSKTAAVASEFFPDSDISSATYVRYYSEQLLTGFQLNASSDGMMLDALPGL